MAKLDKHQMNVIERTIDTLFGRIKARFIMPNGPKQLRGNWNWLHSLEGVYTLALKSFGMDFREETYDKLSRIASNYIDATKEKTKAQIIKNIEDFYVQQKITNGNIAKPLKKELENVMAQASASVERIISTELNSAKNVGILESLDEISAAIGEKDPLVAFFGPIDKDTCDECRRMFLLPDGSTPKVWKKSELLAGYHKKGNTRPSMMGCHPNCRHSLGLIPKGYGFVNGQLDYISMDYDELKKQRG